MPELIINRYIKDSDLQELVGKHVHEIHTRSVFSYTQFTSNGSEVTEVTRPVSDGAGINFQDGNYIFIINGSVLYY